MKKPLYKDVSYVMCTNATVKLRRFIKENQLSCYDDVILINRSTLDVFVAEMANLVGWDGEIK